MIQTIDCNDCCLFIGWETLKTWGQNYEVYVMYVYCAVSIVLYGIYHQLTLMSHSLICEFHVDCCVVIVMIRDVCGIILSLFS